MDKKYYINCRVNTLFIKNIAKRNRHDFRKYTENEIRDNFEIIDEKIMDENIKNIYSRTEEIEKKIMDKVLNNFSEVYKKQRGRKPQLNLVSPFLEGVLTFPHKYQEVETDKKIWHQCLAKFSKILKEETGMEIINIIEHNDETTRHYHLKLKNYKINDNGELITSLHTKKGVRSLLQDIAGKAFKDLNLVRGVSRSITKAKNKTKRAWAKDNIKIMEDLQSGELNLTDDELENLIKESAKPFSGFFRNYLRLRRHDLENQKTQESINKLNNKLEKFFPKLISKLKNDGLNNFEILEKLIEQLNKSQVAKSAQKNILNK